MNRFVIIKSENNYELENKVNEFLSANIIYLKKN